MFNAQRLSLARMRVGLTAKGLADRAGVAPLTITRLEKGENQPDKATSARLAEVLGFPLEFFLADDPPSLDTDAVSFRSLSKMSAKERNAATAAGALGLELSDWVEQKFTLPAPNLIDLSHETNAEIASKWLRQHWGLGERPIGNMIGLLETNGVRVLSLAENTSSVDAFSFWRDGKPYVFLNNFKTAEHSIFDSAHELGHLVMHMHGGPRGQSRSAEREANQFASSFLMPENDVRSRMPSSITVDIVIRAKARWRVSAMAMAYRLHQLAMLSEWQYKSICIELAKRGFRSAEPGGIERETSVILKKVLSQLWSERTTKNDLARELNLPLAELEGLVWGLTGSDGTPPIRGARLNVV